MLRSLVLLAAVSSAAVAAPVPKGIKKKSLDGNWKLVEQNHNGRDDPNFAKWMWVIEGEQLTYRRPDGNGVYQPSESNQKASLTRAADGKAEEMDYKYNTNATTNRAWVELDGEDLAVCYASGANAERPTGVKTGPGIILFKFKRVTDK